MIKQLDGAAKHVIAIEIIDGYTHEDEKSLEKLFEEKLDKGVEKVSMLVKIDNLSLMKSSLKAMLKDGVYAMKHLKYCGKIAIVGESKVEEFLTKADNLFFGSKTAGREERYFHLKDLTLAFEWINLAV